jgi:hypothetical protein
MVEPDVNLAFGDCWPVLAGRLTDFFTLAFQENPEMEFHVDGFGLLQEFCNHIEV